MVLRMAAAWLFAMTLFGAAASQAHAQAVCAEARIEIRQRVMLERQAFDASLRVTNGLSSNITLVGVVVKIDREDGVLPPPGGSFFIKIDRIENYGPPPPPDPPVLPVEILAGSAPTVHWLLIPNPDSGGTLPDGIRYTVGAKVFYRIAGDTEDREVDILPETITVLPQPRLQLDYFLAEEVHGDDPFTPQVEPSIPFTLGVRAANIGHGPARSLSIETAQPQIVENLQGLLVGFEIIDAQIQNEPVAPTLLMDFGTLEPGEAKVGRWRMTTTLSGEFRDLAASYTHANTLGGAQTSLIDPGFPKSYLLIKDVLDDSDAGAEDPDLVPDFLARLITNEIPSDNTRLYDSRGGERDVDVFDSASQVLLSGGGANYTVEFASGLTIEPTTPFHIKIPKPPGMPESADFQVLRGDGSALPAANIWLSKSRPAQGSGWNHFFNLFEAKPPENPAHRSYGVTVLNAPPPAQISGSVYVDSSQNGQPDSGEPVVSEHAVQLTGTTSEGATVSRVRHTSGSGNFLFGDLEPGTYRLDVAALEDYGDGLHSVGSAGGTQGASWIEGIALSASHSGTGYHFAKTFDPSASWLYADLSLAISASTAAMTVNGDVEVTLVLGNAGPDSSQLVSTQLVIPIGWGVVSATPSAGTFDIDRTWVTPALASGGEHSLLLRLRPQVTGQFVISALAMHASDGLRDPDAGNNSAAVMIDVDDPTPIALTIEPTVLPRVLVLVGCSELGDQEHPDLETCVQAKIQTLPTLFAQVEHLTLEAVTAREEFIVALRSGRSNIVWLMESMYLLQPQDWTELSASVYDGDGLVTSDSWSLGVESLASQLLAVDEVQPIDAGATLTSSLLPTTVSIDGEGAVLSYWEGYFSILGEFGGGRGGPAIVARDFGSGVPVTLGFAIGSLVPPSERPTLAKALVALTRPSDRERFGAAQTMSIKLSAEGAGGDGFTLQVDGDGGSSLVAAMPPPVQMDPNSALWSGTFPADAPATHFLTARVADDGVATSLAARLEDGSEQLRLENHAIEHALPETVLLEAIASISQLPAFGGSVDYRAEAIERLNTTLEHLGRGELEDAIHELLSVQYFGCDALCMEPSLTEEVGALLAEGYRGIARTQADSLVLCSDLSGSEVEEVGVAGFVPLVPRGRNSLVGGVAFRNGDTDWQIGLGPQPWIDIASSANVHWGQDEVSWSLAIDRANGAATLNYVYQPLDPGGGISIALPMEWVDARLGPTAAVQFEVERAGSGGGIGASLVVGSIRRQAVAASISVPIGSNAVSTRRVFHAPTDGVAELAEGGVGLSFDSAQEVPSDPAAMVVRIVPGYLRCRTNAP